MHDMRARSSSRRWRAVNAGSWASLLSQEALSASRRLVVRAGAVPDVELHRLYGELHQARRREPLEYRLQRPLLGDPPVHRLLAAKPGGELQRLTSMLAGLLPGTEIGRKVLGTLDTEHRCTVGDLFIVMDPKAFPGGETLAAGVKGYLDELRASRPGKGFKKVIAPGDPEYQLREERLVKGIPHPEEVWHAATQLRSTIGK